MRAYSEGLKDGTMPLRGLENGRQLNDKLISCRSPKYKPYKPYIGLYCEQYKLNYDKEASIEGSIRSVQQAVVNLAGTKINSKGMTTQVEKTSLS